MPPPPTSVAKAKGKWKGYALVGPGSRPKKGPLDPPGTIADSAMGKQLIPIYPQRGIERRFQRRPTVLEGGLDEALEVGVLRYGMGDAVVSMSIELDHELYVGEDKTCHIQVFGPTVSSFHLRFYAVRTSTPLAIVCMNDMSSSTGYILNGKHYPPRAVRLGTQKISSRMIVLKDGDTIQVPNTPQIITYKHNYDHFPIEPNFSTLIEDYTLFSTTSSDHYIDTQFWRIHNYPLGDGTFGVVNLGTHQTSSGGVQVAIKTIDSRTSPHHSWREKVDQEVGNIRALDHPNIMKWLDQIKEDPTIKREKDGEDVNENDEGWNWSSKGIWKAHIVFELATGGDLFSYQEFRGNLSEDEAKFITWQLVLAIDHIHSHNIAHRDIKLENILLHNRSPFPRVLIGDFGFSTTLANMIQSVPPARSGPATRTIDPAGTILNLPPERLKAFTKVSKTGGLGESLGGATRNAIIGRKWFEEEMQMDVWALGVVLYHLIAMDHPYQGLSSGQRSKSRQTTALSNKASAQHGTQDTNGGGTKRKFLELLDDVDEEDEEDDAEERYATAKASKGWDEYRKIHGERMLGGSDSDEMRMTSRAYEDIKVFKDLPPEMWEPRKCWKLVSNECERLTSSLLTYRPLQRISIADALKHRWFETSKKDLEMEYERAVVQRRHVPASQR